MKPTWLYWDDSRLGAAGVCGTRSITPIDNSVTGVDSVSGVHSWDNKGCASNGNGELTNNDSSWGNNRLLDDWTYDSAAATDSLVLTVKPELYVTKVADKKDVKKGETVTYTIKVENKGDATIPHVTDVIPAGLAL